MTDKTLIPPSPSEDDYVRQVASAEPPPLLSETDPFPLFADWMAEALAKLRHPSRSRRLRAFLVGTAMAT